MCDRAPSAPHHPCPKEGGACGKQTELAATAFRLEEKRYKLYKADPKAPKTQRRRCDTDFSDVVDFRNVKANTEANQQMIHRVPIDGEPAFTFTGVPGLLFFPGAIDAVQQARWCREALESFTQSRDFPNNKSSLDSSVTTAGYEAAIRWATLGFKYDWTRRVYHKDQWALFPETLNVLMSSLVRRASAVTQDQFSASGFYEAQTAIVNYFPVGTMMMAHQDVSEVCLEKPLMSMSLGCSCVFLMGTDCRDDKPHAFYLRSGDVVAFTGPSRVAYHAVPRILDDCPEHLLSLPDDDAQWRRHMNGLRINVNVRQVFDEHCPFLFSPTAAPPDVDQGCDGA